MASRLPQNWTPQEDDILRRECRKQLEPDGSGRITDWTAVAENLPSRSNKDCRKRWINHACGGMRKGTWSEDEDDRLRRGFSTHGPQWTRIAERVGNRSADQCAKRWHHVLDPNLDRSEWTPEDNKKLLAGVAAEGRRWQLIREKFFPSRATNNVKNQYTVLINAQARSEQGTRSSKASDASSHPPLGEAADSSDKLNDSSGTAPHTPFSADSFDIDMCLTMPDEPQQTQALSWSTAGPVVPTHMDAVMPSYPGNKMMDQDFAAQTAMMMSMSAPPDTTLTAMDPMSDCPTADSSDWSHLPSKDLQSYSTHEMAAAGGMSALSGGAFTNADTAHILEDHSRSRRLSDEIAATVSVQVLSRDAMDELMRIIMAYDLEASIKTRPTRTDRCT